MEKFKQTKPDLGYKAAIAVHLPIRQLSKQTNKQQTNHQTTKKYPELDYKELTAVELPIRQLWCISRLNPTSPLTRYHCTAVLHCTHFTLLDCSVKCTALVT